GASRHADVDRVLARAAQRCRCHQRQRDRQDGSSQGHSRCASHQNVRRTPSWNVRGSPTAVTCPNVATGLDGYVPAPQLVFRVRSLTWFVTLKASTSPSALTSPPRRKVRLIRRFTVKKSLPVPAFLGMNETDRTSKFGVDAAPPS